MSDVVPMNPEKKSQDARRSLEAQDVQLTKLRQSLEDAIGSHAAYKALKKCGEGTLGESWRMMLNGCGLNGFCQRKQGVIDF